MKKRILSFLLALLLLFGMLPVNVIAEGTENYDGDIGKYVKLNTAVSTFSVYNGETGDTDPFYYADFTDNTIFRIVDWMIKNETLLYRVEFYSGNVTGDYAALYPSEPWFEQTAAGELVFMDTCSVCGKPDCAGHTWCDICNAYDCGIDHTQPECGCCENCTDKEDCDCGCGNCDFCTPADPEVPELKDDASGVIVLGNSFPAGMKLSVYDTDVSAQLDQFGVPASNLAFGLDITLLDAENAVTQPNGTVRVKVPVDAAPGTKVGILHTHGSNTTYMGMTEVLSDGTVEFTTDSFSTFAGFTVDFHYNDIDYSIEGLTSITLSELFPILEIERDAARVIDVTFTDPTLISVTKLDGDWQLTSLQAFDTTEELKIFFADGEVIKIVVTDDAYPDRDKFKNHNSANDAKFYHDGGPTAQGYRNFGVVSGVSSTWSVWDGGKQIMYVYLYDTAGSPVDYSYFNEHPSTSGYLSFSGNYWYEVTDYYFYTGSPSRIDVNTLSMGSLGLSQTRIHWIEVRMHSLNVLDNKTYAKVNQKSKFANDKSGETGNRTVVVYANNVEVDRKTVLFPTFENMSASDISVTPYTGWVCRGDVSGAGATVVVQDGVYKVYLVSRNTIKYDLNGGTGSFADQTKTYGVQLNLHSGEPTKTGYTFNHWVSSHDGSIWAKGANFTPDRADTLVANYSATTYTATFNANGGSVNPGSRSFNIEGALPLPTPTAPTGYVFGGWKVTSASGNWKNGDVYTGTSVEAGKYGDVTLTAVWNVKTVKVTLHNQGATTAGTPAYWYKYNTVVNGVYYYTDAACTQALANYTITKPTKTGYTFAGYYTAVNGGGTQYVDANGMCINNLYAARTEDTDLYAKWNYTVSYNANGGSGTVSSQTQVEKTQITLSTGSGFSRAGYTLTGWNTATDGSGTPYAKGASYTDTGRGSVTLYAQWEADTDTPYTLEIYTQNIEDDDYTKEFQTLEGTTDKTVTVTPDERTGFTYNASKSTVSGKVAGDGSLVLKVYYDRNKYNVTFENEDGTNLQSRDVKYGAMPAYSGATPTKAADAQYTYTFSGWTPAITAVTGDATYTATYTGTVNNYKVQVSLNSDQVTYTGLDGFTVVDGKLEKTVLYDTQITASFTAKEGYEIQQILIDNVQQTGSTITLNVTRNHHIEVKSIPKTYNITWMTDATTEYTKTTATFGTAITLPAAPTMAGYEFTGWTPAIPETMPAKDLTFTAQWDDQYCYELEYDPNTIGKVDGMPEKVYTGWIDDNKYTADLSAKPTRAGYDFLGWATSNTATAADVLTSFELEGIANGTASATLYAVWQRHTGDLKLTFNGGETAPAIVTVSGQGKTITLVLTKAETVIKGLPTGEYSVAVESGNASYVASVKTNSNPKIENNQTAEVEITIGSKGLNWFTAFCWVKNKFGKQN